MGRISSCANFRAFSCHARCSSFNVKSMLSLPLGGHWPLISCQCLGNLEFRSAVAVPGMQEDQCVADIPLHRHIPHHTHGAENLCGSQSNLVDHFGGKDPRNGLKRQICKAAVGVGTRMV